MVTEGFTSWALGLGAGCGSTCSEGEGGLPMGMIEMSITGSSTFSGVFERGILGALATSSSVAPSQTSGSIHTYFLAPKLDIKDCIGAPTLSRICHRLSGMAGTTCLVRAMVLS